MSSDHSNSRQEIIERIKSLVFICIYCNSQNRITASVIDFVNDNSGTHGIAFFICPDCHNKFAVKIEDLGKVTR
jgi:transcription elongation factor Elf1